ncbi:MAG: hypothetical protein ACYC64_20440, partial [Armatimonadota bacterium]
GYEQGRHQVIEIPRAPVRIIDHVIIARRCGYCGKVHIPKLGISDGVVGKMRLGVGLMSLIAQPSQLPSGRLRGRFRSFWKGFTACIYRLAR